MQKFHAADGSGDNFNTPRLAARADPSVLARQVASLNGFVRRAAVAHVMCSPDARRPVEAGADQEQQLVIWPSKRLGAEVRPSLKAVGYELIGGRLLPGDTGPVAQWRHDNGLGQRLTLYVSREVSRVISESQTAFRFGSEGQINVFYGGDKKTSATPSQVDRAATKRCGCRKRVTTRAAGLELSPCQSRLHQFIRPRQATLDTFLVFNASQFN